jgi:hypothetical protein
MTQAIVASHHLKGADQSFESIQMELLVYLHHWALEQRQGLID